MSKLIALLLSATLFITGTMHAQTAASSNQNSPDLKEAVARQTEEIKNESGVIDPKKIEKADRQTPQKNSGKRDKLIIGGIVAGLVVLAVVLALTTKRCVKRSPSGCDFNDVFSNCQCVEYAK